MMLSGAGISAFSDNVEVPQRCRVFGIEETQNTFTGKMFEYPTRQE